MSSTVTESTRKTHGVGAASRLRRFSRRSRRERWSLRALASVKDVAAAAGVSLGTVSNVLNRPELVSAATRERVERAMADLGFVRNEFARQLRMGTSRTLAYVMLDATNPFFTDVAQGIEVAAESADVSLVHLQQQQPFRAASRPTSPR